MELSLVLQFWLVGALLVLTPGADWAYAIGAGLRAKSVLPAVGGVLVDYCAVIVVIALGVGALAAQHPQVLTAMTLAGAGYLLYLGAASLRATAAEPGEGPMIGDRPMAQFLRGAGVSSFNPKGLLLLLALLPQFVAPSGWPTGMQVLALGGIHVVNCAIVYTGVALLARRTLRGRPGAAALVAKISGVILLAFGTALLIEQAVSMTQG